MIRKAWIASFLALCAALPACGGESGESTTGHHSTGTGGSGGNVSSSSGGSGGSDSDCGDGKITGSETCDDENTKDDDGCDAKCAVETGWECSGEPSVCSTICGDGKILGSEECDDGDTDPNDGCSDACNEEAGWECAGMPSVCDGICGDGQMLGTETCDDANTTAGDGCSDTCDEESGYACTGEPSVCEVVCGDGVITAGVETCDDGNAESNDGCDETCTAFEPGFTCAGEPTVCTSICGDFMAVGAEDCDDGNMAPGDGCSATCTFEATCGNGTVEPGESCDDNNMAANDGCGATCQLEAGTACGDAIDVNAMGVKSGDVTTYMGDTTPSMNTTYGDPTCSPGTVGVKRVIHKYTVGGQSASLQIETLNLNNALDNTVLWVYADCQDTGSEIVCDDDSGAGNYSLVNIPALPGGTTLFIVVAGYSAPKVGPYSLKITETPEIKVPSGTCAMPAVIGPGTYSGKTLANDLNNGAGTCTGDTAPDSVFEITFANPVDLTATVSTIDQSFDLGLYVTGDPCGSGAEPAGGCADGTGSGLPETFTTKDLAAGTYYIYVDGFTALDFGQYTLNVSVVNILAIGDPCSPMSQTTRCPTGAFCTGPIGGQTCQNTGVTLLTANFTQNLQPFTTNDFGNDGKTWKRCDQQMGCGDPNATGSASGGPFAEVVDENMVSLNGEKLVAGPLDATNHANVFLEYDHNFAHWPTATDLGAVQVSVDNMNWTNVASYTADNAGHKVHDISAIAANQATVYVRFNYDDQTGGGNSWAASWQVDDVKVVGF